MALVMINNSTTAVDSDHIESMDIQRKIVTTTSGAKMSLSDADFQAIFQAKAGGK